MVIWRAKIGDKDKRGDIHSINGGVHKDRHTWWSYKKTFPLWKLDYWLKVWKEVAKYDSDDNMNKKIIITAVTLIAMNTVITTSNDYEECCATNREVDSSIPDGTIWNF